MENDKRATVMRIIEATAPLAEGAEVAMNTVNPTPASVGIVLFLPLFPNG